MAMSTTASRSLKATPPSRSDEIVTVITKQRLGLGRTQSNLAAARSFRLQLREEDHVADAFLAEEHHAQAVDADADAARRGHAVFEGDEEIFVELLLLAARLMFERVALRDGVVLLGVAGRNLLPVDAALE